RHTRCLSDWSSDVCSSDLTNVSVASARRRTVSLCGLGWLDLHAHSETVRRLAEATLTFVLFADASRIDLRALRREWGFPARLLGIGRASGRGRGESPVRSS